MVLLLFAGNCFFEVFQKTQAKGAAVHLKGRHGGSLESLFFINLPVSLFFIAPPPSFCWLPSLFVGFPACLSLPSLFVGFPACLLASQLVCWLPSLFVGSPACLLASRPICWLPNLFVGFPAYLLASQPVCWLPNQFS